MLSKIGKHYFDNFTVWPVKSRPRNMISKSNQEFRILRTFSGKWAIIGERTRLEGFNGYTQAYEFVYRYLV